MPFSHIPTTADGRAVHIAAFELAMKRFADDHPGAITSRHQDAMVAAIIEMVAVGTTHLDLLADNAIKRAREL